jgi:pantoate--beta-alanine ligase
MAELIESISAMAQAGERLRQQGKRIALVPTMGALHEGHLALIARARAQSDTVVTSVFVNPTQFGKGEDFERYPRTLPADHRKAGDAGAHYVFAPSALSMYPPEYSTYVQVEQITDVLEGRVRPGHFRGVATVVAKLFHIVMPHLALFGQKDAQQVAVIRSMIRDLNFPIELVIVPTVREADGLAMSSRNAYLTPGQRGEAPVLFRALRRAEEQIREKATDASGVRQGMRDMIEHSSTGVIEYLSIAHGETLEELSSLVPGTPVLLSLAVRFGTTRLIDNIPLVIPPGPSG